MLINSQPFKQAYYTILLLVCCYFNKTALAQTVESVRRITIVGTIHTGNRFFNHHTLYRLLKANSPDIVLREQSESFERVFGLRTGYFLGLMKPSIEQLSLQKYTQQHRQVIVIPYDTVIPNRRAYMASLAVLDTKFHQQLDAAKMTQSDSLIWVQYKQLENNYYTYILNQHLSAINQDSIVGITKALYTMEAALISPLVTRYSTDSSLTAWFEHEQRFWLLRNEYMARQIIQVLEAYPDKRIMVMAGFNHKYLLTDLLRKKYGKNIQFLPVQIN